jgi:hypothetical protein
MAVSAPYADSEMVALLQKNLLLGATNFTQHSPLPKNNLDNILVWVSAAIDMQLNQAGYLIPLQDLAGETWPTHQTAYLQLVTILGAIAMISPALKPAPAQGPGRTGSSESTFQKLYNTELDRIYSLQTNRTYTRLRAKFYLGTPAEKAITEPASPKSDYSRSSLASGHLDPYKRMYFWDYTMLQNRMVEIFKTDFNWLQLAQLDLTGGLQELAFDPVLGYGQ